MSGQYGGNMWEEDGGSDWGTPGQQQQGSAGRQYQFYTNSDMVLNADQLSFQQSNFENSAVDYSSNAKMSFFYDQPQNFDQPTMELLQPASSYDFDNEPPLLEELEIYPELIVKKIKSVLDPFAISPPVGDHDLGGPLIFCLLFGVTTFFSAGRINFSYVYGIGVSSCLFMYVLLSLMSSREERTSLVAVASVMGYGLIPVVALSTVAVFLRITNPIGVGFSLLAILWSALAASKEFTSIAGDDQRLLVAYPCAILYGVFTLLVLF